MLRKIGRLFIIKTNWEAYMIIYALALGAVERGSVYLTRFPGFGGKLLFLACTGAVFMAGAKILDCIKFEKAALLARRASEVPAPPIIEREAA
ncbi:hypothetical protein [Novosphingobium sp. P6W]|uniref:hypothetical protein n=1 Tax=Novosphingobium sp. P6W TaxID=1609758 RepID=UPI0005C2C682|nr:hypothetical protein [Novosphingobium sp. P6W]AXB78079.1 hypothetical protein TQ38_006945 [Novosphingobium sp. P6W]KIS30134.1 membrane protein [Novosphingobium sp. P6W]